MPFSKLKGRKVMLCDMHYQRGNKTTEWKDYLTVIYKDMITDKKEKLVIESPTIDLFVVKPEYRNFTKARHFIRREMVDVKTVKYKDVLHEIAKIAEGEYLRYYKDHPSFKERKNLFKYPYCLGGDIDIETYYRTLWEEECGNDDRKSPTKIVLDIEVDQINFSGNIARHGECEINAVTVIDDKENISYTFLYDNGNNPQIQDFINCQDKFQETLHELFDETYGHIEYKIYMFKNEEEMIRQLFKLIHSLNRDFCLIYNMGYDIPYIIDRCHVLGLDPKEVMCAKDFPLDTLYYYEDKTCFEFSQKRDYFDISDYTHYIDQLITYASLRKSQGTVKRVNLGAVAQKELKDTKLDYSDAGNIRTLPYENYFKFVLYNIKDCLLQIGIDRKVKDLDNLYLISTTNKVPYKDALKQTVVFRGMMYAYLKKQGYVLGHNVNFNKDTGGKFDENGDRIYNDDEDEEDEKYQGALNGDPTLNLSNGIKLYGARSKYLYGLVIDFDFSAGLHG